MLLGVYSAMEYMGYGDNIVRFRKHLRYIQVLGAKVSRNGFLWSKIEKEKGNYNWSDTDLIIDGLLRINCIPLMVIHIDSPFWANKSNSPQHVPTEEAEFKDWLWLFKRFVADIMIRYKGAIKYIEIGNEPNIGTFWKPKPNSRQYALIAQSLQEVIKSIDNDVKVAVGSVTVPNHVWLKKEQKRGKDFIRGAIKNGLKPSIVSVHPYANKNEPPTKRSYEDGNVFLDTITIYKQVKEMRYDCPIWITEVGWERNDGKRPISEEKQAVYLRQSIEVAKEKMPFVEMYIWFWDWDRFNVYSGYGLINDEGELTLAGKEFQKLTYK